MLRKITKYIFLLLVLGVLLVMGTWKWMSYKIKNPDPLTWRNEIHAFQTEDARDGFETGGIVFAGSSSIAHYDDLENLMQPLRIIQRGFGGAEINDIIYYQKDIIDKYKPSMVVLYVGAIDVYFIHRNDPERISLKLENLVQSIRTNNPQSKIIYLSIRSSPFYPELHDDYAVVTENMRRLETVIPGFKVINADHSVLDKNGELRKDLYKLDRLHLNDEGNRLWWGEIKRQLIQNLPTPLPD